MMNDSDLASLLIGPQATIRQAIACIDKNEQGITLVASPDRRLLATVTDGDIRRAILAGIDLDSPVTGLFTRKGSSYAAPILAPLGTDREALLKIMQQYAVRQVPLVDESGCIAGLATLEELVPEQPLPLQAVILAGGETTRLHALAEDLPRPMLPVGNRPLLELTIDQLRQSGIRQIHLTTHYKPEAIQEHFQDGESFGVEIHYLNEPEPLGTAGALGMLEESDEPVLVMNGDILTKVDFRAILDFHKAQHADLTVAVRSHDFQIPYGVIEADGEAVTGVTEKPSFQRFINAGIYLLNPDMLQYIPKDHHPYDMPDLIKRLMADGRRVVRFPIHEYWLDIQDYADYQQMLSDAQKGVFADPKSALVRLEPGSPTPPGFIPLCVPEIRGNEWAYIKECLDTNWVSSVGPFVDRFEQSIARFVGAQYGVAASTGTAAIHIALLVAGVQPNDEVLVSTLTFIAPANAIRYAGAWPVFVDVEPNYWEMDPAKLKSFLETGCQWRGGALYNRETGRRVSAIVPVHVLGHPCDMDPILELARKYNLTVIEDATESLGARYKGQMTGHLGDIACFSFNGNKLITTGGGGMIVTDNEAWARKAKYLTTQAKDDPLEYVHNEIGYNYRLTNLQSALGCAQAERLPEYIAAKREIARRYSQAFASIPGLTPMREAEWAYSTFWMYTMLVDESQFGLDSRELLRHMQKAQIQTRPLWQPIHLSPAHHSGKAVHLEVAEELYRQAISLPCSVGLTREEQDKVVAVCREVAQH